ncbi:HD domain-containing phosphohydrolase [Wukongibacter sp. M2B1]|uniref:HD domain-containing phosphohydrolase n=1 Tax=Wukongibacter sp. M2B1 TaxID=3088895 RepID=UPI003D78FC75
MLFGKSFRNRLIMIFLGVVIVPITLLGGVTYKYLLEYIVEEYDQRALKEVITDTESVNLSFGGKATVLKSLAKSLGYSILDTQDRKIINRYLREQKKNIDNEVLNLYVATNRGDKYDANSWTKYFGDIDFRNQEWYKEAAKRDGIYLSKPYLDIATKQDVITISVSIYNTEGKFIGVLGVDYLFDNIMEQINSIDINGEAFHIVIDDNSDVIYDGFGLKGIEYTDFINQPEKFVKSHHMDKDIIGIYTKMESMGFGIVTLQETQDYYKRIKNLIGSFVFIYLVIVLLMFLYILYISKRVSIPVVQLKKGVREILDGNYDTKLSITKDSDFGELMDSFNLMANTIKDNYENLVNQSDDLIIKNRLLQETYVELEASYEQLQATTEQLDYSETKYRTLIENITDLIWVTTPDGEITYINDMVKEILDYDPNDLIGKSIFSIMCPRHNYEDGSYIVEEFGKKNLKNFDLCCLKANSNKRIILAANINNIFLDGKPVSVHGIGRDVTEKRRLQDKILKKNKELRILNNISSILASKVKMDDLFETIVDKIHELLEIEMCTLRLLEDEKLELKAASGIFKNFAYEGSIDVGDKKINRVMLSKDMLILRDVKIQEDPYYGENIELLKITKNLDFLIFIPLKLEGSVIGVLNIAALREIRDVEIEILRAFSNHITVAIEKARLYENLKDSYFKTIKTLATAVEAKDSYTEGHSLRVAKYSTLIAKRLELDDKRIEEIHIAGILHDIGKIGIDDGILAKPGKLSEEEYITITKHPEIGEKILSHIGLSENILNGVLLHHKGYDLKGYPKNVRIDNLPLEACIIGAADAFDAITTTRSYSKARTIEEAIDELDKNKGTQFCPLVVDSIKHICKNNRGEIEALIRHFRH